MSALVVFLVFVIIAGVLYLAWCSAEPQAPSPPPDPEKIMQAAVELHRIHRRLDVADLKHRQRREAARLKRELTEVLDEDDRP